MKYRGRAWVFGDDIDTDVIIPARYLSATDADELARHCMEPLFPDFASKVSRGDIVVAGKNFGCGSSREHAPLALKATGISCVIAKSFARIFYRNAINIGLPIFEAAEAVGDIRNGDEIEVDAVAGTILNLSRGRSYSATAFPEFMQQIISAGGLIEYVKKRKGGEGS